MKKIGVFLALLLVCTVAWGQTLRIGSFNTRIFADTKIQRPGVLTTMAIVANQVDILALQEIGSNGSKASDAECKRLMSVYLAEVNRVAGKPVWAYINGNQYAFLYRTDKVKLLGTGLYSGSKTFTYTPLVGYFADVKTGLKLLMMTIHTRPSLAEPEILSLPLAMREMEKKYGSSNSVILGDFNSDGTYYKPGTGKDLAGFAGFITVIPNGTNTTVDPDNDYTYARIELSSSLAPRYFGVYGVIAFSSLVDIKKVQGTSRQVGDLTVSDHYPVWAELKTGK